MTYPEFLMDCAIEWYVERCANPKVVGPAIIELMQVFDSLLIEMNSGLFALGE